MRVLLKQSVPEKQTIRIPEGLGERAVEVGSFRWSIDSNIPSHHYGEAKWTIGFARSFVLINKEVNYGWRGIDSL
jgi:hypothetical protein